MKNEATARMQEIAERLFELREKRSGVRKIYEDYGHQTETAERELMELMETVGVSAVTCDTGTLTLTMKASAKLRDWPTLKEHIMKNPENIDLLEKRVSASGCKERWQTGEEIPGVDRVDSPDLAYRGLK